MFIARVANTKAKPDSGGEYSLLWWSEDLDISWVQSSFPNIRRSTIPFCFQLEETIAIYHFATYPKQMIVYVDPS
jgi:hypothetical protein